MNSNNKDISVNYSWKRNVIKGDSHCTDGFSVDNEQTS